MNLRQVNVPVVADSTCRDPSVYGTALHASTMLCAGSYPFGGRDSWIADSIPANVEYNSRF